MMAAGMATGMAAGVAAKIAARMASMPSVVCGCGCFPRHGAHRCRAANVCVTVMHLNPRHANWHTTRHDLNWRPVRHETAICLRCLRCSGRSRLGLRETLANTSASNAAHQRLSLLAARRPILSVLPLTIGARLSASLALRLAREVAGVAAI